MIQADAPELLITARNTLLAQVLPEVSGDKAYQVRMIANAMAIAARELREADRYAEVEHEVLGDLLATPATNDAMEEARRLCERIESGHFDSIDNQRRLIEGLSRITRAKLSISNPKLINQD